jgi:hypothetical protein
LEGSPSRNRGLTLGDGVKVAPRCCFDANAISLRSVGPARRDQDPLIDHFLEPGALVRHPQRSDWGIGQVQSVSGHRVTVNFEEAGKMTIDARQVALVYVGPDPREKR